jgi:hypothetical protein
MVVEKVRIKVTQDDIKQGARDDCIRCPVALALNRACPGRGRVTVDNDSFYFDWESEVYVLPKKARDFIFDFDIGRAVRPIAFDIFVEATNG